MRLLIAACAAAFAAWAMPAVAADWDIAGLRFGMTPEEAAEAMKAYDERMVLQTEQALHRFRVAGKTVSGEPFVRLVAGQIPGGDLKLFAVFAPPPTGGGLVAVERYDRDKTRSRSQATWRAALEEKYGAPDHAEVDKGASDTLVLEWLDGEGVQCFRRPVRISSIGQQVIEQIADGSGKLHNAEAEAPEDCAAFLVYSVGADPVFAVYGRMVDVPRAARAELDAIEWMHQQIEAGTAAAAPAAKPKL